MRRMKVIDDRKKTAPLDLLLCALGFEERSTFVASKIHKQALCGAAIAFPDRQVLSFKKNRAWFERKKFRSLTFGLQHRDNVLAIHRELTHCASKKSDTAPVEVVVDTSSMSRPMIGVVIEALATWPSPSQINASFAYAPAAYSDPPHDMPPTVASEPVTPFFSGWTIDPKLPINLALGLGYEFERAAGAVELLEPERLWSFVPAGEDSRYDKALASMNNELLKQLADDQIVYYQVGEPAEIVRILEGIAYAFRDSARTVFLPFGPKLFSVCCMLVGINYLKAVTVWRVSGGQAEVPADKAASGKLIWLHTNFC